MHSFVERKTTLNDMTMKKLIIIAALAFGLFACRNNEQDPQQTIDCSITEPKGGEFNVSENPVITIKGEAETNTGKIIRTELKIGDQVIQEVTETPFSYEFNAPDDIAEGNLTISLAVEGDKGATANDEVTVVIKKNSEPVEQTVTCKITNPASGSEINISDTRIINIVAEASAETGKIESAIVKVNGQQVHETSKMPVNFEYTIPETAKEGEMKIALEVTGDLGGKASDEITVSLKKVELPDPGENEFVDPRDGKIYKTVVIGEQTWFAENLAYLPAVFKSDAAPECNGAQRYFVLNYEGEDVAAAKETKEYKTYGVLYNWYAAMGQDNAEGADSEAVPSGVQGPCPDGWHVPSAAEWKILEDYVASQLEPVKGNGIYIDGSMWGEESYWEYEEGLKNVWSALADNTKDMWGATSMGDENPDLKNGPRNTFGLSIRPAGQVYHVGGFGFSNTYISLWTTEMLSQGAGTVDFSVNDYGIAYSKYGTDAKRGYPVRCVKD